jgi:hypothetical protein
MATELVRIPNVRAISDGLALICELPDRRRIGVPQLAIDPSSQVQRPGDHGVLVISNQLAIDLGVTSYGLPEPASSGNRANGHVRGTGSS